MLKKNDIKLQKKEKKEKKCNTCWLIETQSLTDFSLRKRLAKNLCERERNQHVVTKKYTNPSPCERLERLGMFDLCFQITIFSF